MHGAILTAVPTTVPLMLAAAKQWTIDHPTDAKVIADSAIGVGVVLIGPNIPTLLVHLAGVDKAGQ